MGRDFTEDRKLQEMLARAMQKLRRLGGVHEIFFLIYHECPSAYHTTFKETLRLRLKETAKEHWRLGA